MKAYFIRRLLLVIPTLLGITLLVFTISRFSPGGPYEKALLEAAAGGEGKGGDGKNENLSDDLKESLEEQYGHDKSLLHAYAQWLGILPKENYITKTEFGGESISKKYDRDNEARFILRKSDRLASAKITRSEKDVVRKVTSSEGVETNTVEIVVSAELESFEYLDGDGDPADDGWAIRVESPDDRKARWAKREGKTVEDCPKEYDFRVVAYQKNFAGLLQGDLGRSYLYGDTVWSLILDRIPISLYLGILSTLIIYATCIPLGIFKAIKHQSVADNISSIIIFIGYAIPGYALGAVLVVFLGARAKLFPIFGLTSENFAELSIFGQLIDLAHHTVLPLSCYVVSGFAYLTMLMKNNLMENLSSDYVRTAMAKGVTFRKAVTGHAFRNSFIPIATGLGGLITMFIGGSMLIEKVFDIPGFGLLQFQAVTGKDIPVVMGTLTISAFLMLLGNILSDFIVALVDPRIKFH
jgi:microcin C transport system permease protein